jgi:AbrB family looped-hinge helix DNA binding protein
MTTATVTSKGQVTIPKDVRDRLGVREGQQLEFRFDQAGRLTVEVVGGEPTPAWVGSLKGRAREKTVSIEEMKAAIRERAARKLRRTGHR